MKPSQLHLWGLPFVIALVAALAPSAAIAQSSAKALDATAPVVPDLQQERRLMSPEQLRDSATTPGDLRPERPVTPQINVPFGKPPPSASPTAEARPLPRSAAASATGVDDAAARCEAQDNDSLRAVCRAKLARASNAGPLGEAPAAPDQP
jgi:hypothetical protein